MAALAFQSAQTVERRIVVDGEVIGPETYTDSFAEFRDVFSRFFAPMRFERVRISTAPFQYVISTPSGEIDLDDLSDGEKAVFTMVFDIIRRDIRNSVILIDEPELHLHPDLAVKLAQLLPTIRPDNQIWLATQCAEIVRKVPTESVYRVAKVCDGLNSQAQRIFSSDDMRATLAELVGNLGLVTLNRRTVFLEGTEQSIDRHILETLYADRLSEVQFVPCGPVESVNKVSDKVLQLLQEASEFNYFYAIRDRDFMTSEDALRLEREGRGRLFVWDRYHIENYLLDGPVLLAATRALAGSRSPFGSPEEVMARCREIASDMVPGVVAKRLDLHVRFTRPVPRASTDPSRPLDHSREVMEAMIEVAKDSCKDLPAVKEQAEQALLGALSDNSWVSVFPGRDILRRLAGELSVGYEELRNVAVAQLSAPPQGIAHVMSAILAA
jgi:hypothetical protein